MFHGVRGRFVRAVGDGEDPKSIPKHYVDYYDEALALFRKFGSHQGIDEVPENYWPLVCLMAEMRKEVEGLRLKVERLEGPRDDKPSNLQPSNLQPATLEQSSTPKIDGRSREAKALKTAQDQLVEA